MRTLVRDNNSNARVRCGRDCSDDMIAQASRLTAQRSTTTEHGAVPSRARFRRDPRARR